MRSVFHFVFLIFLFFFITNIPVFAKDSDFTMSAQCEEGPKHGRKFILPQDSNDKMRYMNYNGRKMMRSGRIFNIIGIKIEEKGEDFVFSIFFNDAVNSNSLHSQMILINDRPLPPTTEFLFNKSRRMVQFSIKSIFFQNTDSNKNFSLKISGPKSFDGRAMKQIEIQRLSINSFKKFSHKEGSFK